MTEVLVAECEAYRGSLLEAVRRALPSARIRILNDIEESTLIRLRPGTAAYAFIGLSPGFCSALEAAVRIRRHFPESRIIFCADLSDYVLEAYECQADGYLVRPVKAGQIAALLERLDKGHLSSKQRIRIQTFGPFEVYVNGRRVHFPNRKSRELLAYLVDRRGGAVTTREISAVLWEDRPYTPAMKNRVQRVKAELRRTLEEAGIVGILQHRRNHLCLDVSWFDCDYYRLCDGDAAARRAYIGEYMTSYSWAETTEAALTAKCLDAGAADR